MRTQPLEPWTFEVTTTFLIAASLATRDFHPVHHDHEWARAHGLPGPIVNIMTMEALALRYVTDQFAPGPVRSHSLQLIAINVPGDTMSFRGNLQARNVEVEISNQRGPCARAAVRFDGD